MGKDNKKEIKEIQVKAVIISDDKKTIDDFFTSYSEQCIHINKTDDNQISLTKRINGTSYFINLFSMTDLIARMITITQLSLCVMIIFDMTKQLDTLLDKWLIWLRDNCKYEGRIILLGYIPNSIEMRTEERGVLEEEVNELIKQSETHAVFKYIEENSDEMIKELDNVIISLTGDTTESIREEQSNQGSMKNGCIIV